MKVLLAVSGGIDSMYLAYHASDFFPEADFAVAHCNFQLRGAESDGDEDFVRNWCSEHDLRIFVKRFDTLAYASETGKSTEMAARDLRYSWFSQLCTEEGFDGTAVAHNANDNAETLILNLLRGTGSRGLRGMSECRGVSGGLRLFRPMLGIERNVIREWMANNGHCWREDSTNAESVFKRNIIRNDVFPLFERLNPAFIRTLGEDMQRFAQADDIVEDYFLSHKDEILEGNSIAVDRLLELKHWRHMLWRLTEHCGFSAGTFSKLTALLERYRTEKRGTVTLGGKVFESPTHRLSASKGRLTITENTGKF